VQTLKEQYHGIPFEQSESSPKTLVEVNEPDAQVSATGTLDAMKQFALLLSAFRSEGAFNPSGLAVSSPTGAVSPRSASRQNHFGRALVTKRSPMYMQDSAELRSEVENPGGKFLLFALPVLFGAAGIATYFGLTALLAEVTGFRDKNPETLPSLGIDLVALGSLGFLWRREYVQNEKRLKRIRAGAALSKLRLEVLGGPNANRRLKLADLRSGRLDTFDEQSRRVIIVAAEEEVLGKSLADAQALSSRLFESDFIVVPVFLQPSEKRPQVSLPPREWVMGEVGASRLHLGIAMQLEGWRDVLESELDTALEQDKSIAGRGLTIILKKNGRVGTRRLGLPNWLGLVGDVDARAAAGLDVNNI